MPDQELSQKHRGFLFLGEDPVQQIAIPFQGNDKGVT
jgi:hypothetical protein